MELKEDITERKEQADRIVGNPKTSPEELTKWYDLWSKIYEQVRTYTHGFSTVLNKIAFQ